MQRMTRQRAAISELLASLDDFRSAQQVHELLRARGEAIGLATVYRTLQAFADSGELDVRHSPDGETSYRRCKDRDHHHHLVCRVCGTTVELAAEVVERWAQEVGATYSFVAVEHTAELTGTCAACAAGVRPGEVAS